MLKNKQLINDNKHGDCFRASLTSMLGIPNDPELPNVDDREWLLKWEKILGRFGLALEWNSEACWMRGYWIASVTSKNFENTTHADSKKERAGSRSYIHARNVADALGYYRDWETDRKSVV